MDATTLLTFLNAARDARVAAETTLQTARDERDAAVTTEVHAAALADIDPTDATAHEVFLLAQQRLAAAEQAVGTAEDEAADATEALQQAEDAWAAAQHAAQPASMDQNQQLIALLVHNQQQLQQVLIEQRNERVVFQQALAGAPTPVRASARHDSIITTVYDINNPGTFGTMSARDIKPNTALDLVRGTVQYTALDWLRTMEQACKFYRVDYPAAFASRHLIKEASTIFNAAFMDRDVYTITWGEFREWLLKSPLHDRLADQRLLDDWAKLQQGNLSIKEFAEKTTRMYGMKNNHPALSTYPEFYFVDVFKRAVNPEIKSLLRITDPSTTLASITAEALNIGVPLEASGFLRQASTFPNFPPPFRGGGGLRGGGDFPGRGRGSRFQGGGRGQLNGPAGQLNGLAGQFNGTPTPPRVGGGCDGARQPRQGTVPDSPREPAQRPRKQCRAPPDHQREVTRHLGARQPQHASACGSAQRTGRVHVLRA